MSDTVRCIIILHSISVDIIHNLACTSFNQLVECDIYFFPRLFLAVVVVSSISSTTAAFLFGVLPADFLDDLGRGFSSSSSSSSRDLFDTFLVEFALGVTTTSFSEAAFFGDFTGVLPLGGDSGTMTVAIPLIGVFPLGKVTGVLGLLLAGEEAGAFDATDDINLTGAFDATDDFEGGFVM